MDARQPRPSPGSLASILVRTTEDLVQHLAADYVYVCLPDPGGGTASLHPLYEQHVTTGPQHPSSFTLAGTVIDEILGDGRPRILERPFPGSCSALELGVCTQVRTMMLVPLEGSAGPLGTVILASRGTSGFGEGQMDAIRPLVARLARAVEAEVSSLE